MENKELLKDTAEKMGVVLTEDMLEKFMVYKDMLLEWNEKINLTAITDEKEIMIKHFADCVSIGKHVKFKDGEKVIDVGTGAGFPPLSAAGAARGSPPGWSGRRRRGCQRRVSRPWPAPQRPDGPRWPGRG